MSVLAITSLLFASCEKDSDVISPETKVQESFAQTDYNLDMKNFTLAVGKALKKSSEFRHLIKTEVLKQFDGDYDVLLSHIMEKEISSSTAKGQMSFSVSKLLNNSFPKNGRSEMNFKSKGATIIEALSNKYPRLQISIL